MRTLVFLKPTNRYGTKGAYTSFRKALAGEGFVLVQPEVFMRVSSTHSAAQQLVQRIAESVPPTGRVCVLTLTERQFASM